MAQNGGARPGAGRKPGQRNKLRVTDFFNGDERDQLIMQAKQKALIDGDKEMIKFLWEQLFGKATQRVINEDEDGNSLQPLLVKILREGNSN